MAPKKLRASLLGMLALGYTGVLAQASQLPAWAAPAATVPQGVGRLLGTTISAATGQPLAYATVAVLNAASQPVGGAVGGEDGRFVLPGLAPGTYTVRVSLLGYQELLRPGVVVPASGGEVPLGVLPLTAAAQKLGEVVVTARKPLIEELVDRTVYHAENDETTRGGDATDVLRRVPLLSLDLDGNVRVRGSQNIKVLINNKPSTITANSVADGLRQLPADQIRRVEVITAPSAKYDAEGSGGIINIVTKGNALHGGQLALDGSGGTRSGTLNLSGNYRTGRMGFALGGFGRAGYNTPGSFTNEQLTTTPATGAQTRTTQAADTRQNQLFGRYTLGWDFDINAHQGLAASLTYGTRNATTYQDALATATTELATGRTSSSVRNVQLTDDSGTIDASLAYTHTYEVPQRELSALALYSRNNRTYAFMNDTYAASDASQLGRSGNDNPSANQELTAQLDYQTPIGARQLLEVGVKDIQRRVRSDYRYYGQVAAVQAANSFTYRQQVAAAYAAYTLSLPHGFTLKPGVRYEYTALAAELGTGPVGDIPNYGLLVPSVNVLHKLNNGNVLKLAYNRRIQRPSLQFLNPNLQAANPLIQTQGNPALRPEYTNNYELGYGTLLGPANLNFSVFARNTTGAIQSVRTPLRDAAYPGAVRIDYLNIGQENACGGSAFFSLDVGNKLSLSGGLDAYYAVLQNNVPDPNYAARNAGWVLGGRLYGSYALPKGWNVQLFSFYRGQQVQLQGSQSSFAVYSMSLKHDVAGKKGSLGLGAENFFSPTNAVRSDIASPLLSQQSTTVQHLTSFKVYFSYRLGQLTAEPRPHKNVKNDDLKTDENGGGSQGNSATPSATRPAPPAPATPAPPAPKP
ncbi:TonB-dependent receptor domain-containing protein [Hymenobacter cheonanensis]|uniref:TonB-dependent receptor domain-containing protein n=1 Tax=Hymenobacter sp. CA2-7 TaxID=3063993 RepID=UPI002713228C|nr:TonB-dependent receptor [Hymenobacter sp. CA2-7]MDO7886275.1 TonB-dependent receptor [Hymenobacter sp. CA2-7]